MNTNDSNLTNHELQLANFVLQGFAIEKIATIMNVPPSALDVDLKYIQSKLKCSKRINSEVISTSSITQRELDILAWMHKGKGLEQISMILGVSTITVKKNIAAIKQKTKCYTQFQLGELFSRLWRF